MSFLMSVVTSKMLLSSESPSLSICIPPRSGTANRPVTISIQRVSVMTVCDSSYSSVAANRKPPFPAALLDVNKQTMATSLSFNSLPLRDMGDLMGVNMRPWLMHERLYFRLMAAAKCKIRSCEGKKQRERERETDKVRNK